MSRFFQSSHLQLIIHTRPTSRLPALQKVDRILEGALGPKMVVSRPYPQWLDGGRGGGSKTGDWNPWRTCRAQRTCGGQPDRGRTRHATGAQQRPAWRRGGGTRGVSPSPCLGLSFHQDSENLPHRGDGKRKGRVADCPAVQVTTGGTRFSPAASGFLRRNLYDRGEGEERERGRRV